jgi:hypothetical protein
MILAELLLLGLTSIDALRPKVCRFRLKRRQNGLGEGGYIDAWNHAIIMFRSDYNEGGGIVSDLARWKVHGPVKTVRSEFATWDVARQDWQPVRHFNLASFRVDGALQIIDTHNQDGTIAHSRWLYDEAARMLESHSWMNEGPIDRSVYVYDERGRAFRTTHLSYNGTQTDAEVFSYDADGRKTKVQFLFPRESGSEDNAENACRVNIGYTIEGTDSAYSAPGATTMTVNYDEKQLPAKISFHDANQCLLSYVILMRDSAGRLLSEEMYQGEKSPFQKYLNNASLEDRERLAALLEVALGNVISSTKYKYDAKGRQVSRDHRMGSLGEDFTTYIYGDRDDPVKETTEHKSREGSFDETGNMHYSSDRMNVQHNQLEYLYDEHENWTERIVSFRSESEPKFQRSNIERRIITYYSA